MSLSRLFIALHVIFISFGYAENLVTIVSVNGIAYSGDRRLQPGDRLPEGSQIRTESAAGVKILLPDRSIMDVGPLSKITIEKATKADEISSLLELGTVRSSVQKKTTPKGKFTIRTKASVLAVRGTEFVVNVEEVGGQLKEQVSVVGGLVERLPAPSLPNTEAKSISAGEQLTLAGQITDKGVTLQQMPVVAKMDEGKMAGILASNTVQDRTFKAEIELRKEGPEGQQTGMRTFERVQTQFRQDVASREPSSDMPPPTPFNRPMEPPRDRINPLDRLSPDIGRGAVTIRISFNET